MKKLFHKIYWNQANLTGDAAGETYAFVYAQPACLVMKSYAPFSKRQSWFEWKSWFEFHSNHWNWFRAKIDEKWNRMNIIIK